MKPEAQFLLSHEVEGAIAAAILREWAAEDFYPFSFPSVTVFPWHGDLAVRQRKSADDVGRVEEEYVAELKCPTGDVATTLVIDGGEARVIAKNFRNGSEPGAMLSATVREMLAELCDANMADHDKQEAAIAA